MSGHDHTRNDAIAARRSAGESIGSLAREFAISTKRVREIVKRADRRQQARRRARDEGAKTIDGLFCDPSPVHTRIRNALKNANIETVDQLRAVGLRPLPAVYNLGRKCIDVIEETFLTHGLTWAPSEEAVQALQQHLAERAAARERYYAQFQTPFWVREQSRLM